MLAKSADKHLYDFYIFSIAHAIRYMNDEKLAEYAITNRQARLLGILYRSLQSKEEVNNKKLQDLMNLTGPSVTSLLNGLEKNAFIVRSPKKNDRRIIEYQLTDKSNKLIEDMEQVFINTEKQLLKNMTDEEQQTFLHLLEKVYKNVAFAKII